MLSTEVERLNGVIRNKVDENNQLETKVKNYWQEN